MTNGKLYIVPTPIGNLEDITLRALRILKEVDLVLAEDTRKSSFLLQHFNIQNKLQSHHKFNEHRSSEKIIEQLKQGLNIALVSDAGTPSISDPGFLIVRACIENNIPVECLPGPTAVIPALILSGFACDRFVFEGFLPHKKGRQTKFKELAQEERTMVVYESPHRIEKTLQQMTEYFEPERRICVCRELTKKFEESIRGNLQEIVANLSSYKFIGEIVLVIEGKQ
jgi:16S rRNA (cytidine1402-2'-O)-methyltransferase